jgi:hypothetical protein
VPPAGRVEKPEAEAKLVALRPADLERRDCFKACVWVFYLPPKGAFDDVLDEIIAEALNKEEMGFFARVAVEGVLLVVKPKIRRAIEAMRQGLMFMTVVEAQTRCGENEVAALTGAYIEALMPFDSKNKPPGGTDHERAVNAVREQLRKNAAKAEPEEALKL